MLYLTTGANGAGKTLLTLWDVRQQQLAENRPVFYYGFEAVVEVLEAEFGWKPHKPQEWNAVNEDGTPCIPDGAILVWDEAQEYIGAKLWGTKQVPQWVQDLARYRRKRGIDIWVTTPHPSMVHVDVRRLIESPSWHRHLKRAFGADVVSVIKFNAPNVRCEQPGSGEGGQVTVQPFRKEVYAWYRSASLHTAKRTIPRAVWIMGVCAVLVPLCVFGVYRGLRKNFEPAVPPGFAAAPARTAQGPVGGAPGGETPARPMTPQEYVEARSPRIPGLAYTAPAYDAVTKPTVAPYPAACILHHADGRCDCYTQQATRLEVPRPVCVQIATRGIFVDWHQADAAPKAAPAPAASASSIPPGEGLRLAPVEPVRVSGEPLRLVGQAVGQWR